MRIFNFWTLTLLALFPSCGKDTTASFQLPANIYTIDKVYDTANNGNSLDLRVEVYISSTLVTADLVDVRIVISKVAKTITQDQLTDLKSGNFFSIPISNQARQTIKLITSKDSDGDEVVNGTSYKMYVGIIGKESTRQLSAPKNFTLADKPIYAGDYIGTWEDLGPPGPASFPMSLRIAEDYSGKMFYANSTFTPFGSGTQDATTTMQISGTAITSFLLDQLIPGYHGGCAATKTLTGNFNDDINLVLNTFTWADCDGTRDVKLKFTRQ